MSDFKVGFTTGVIVMVLVALAALAQPSQAAQKPRPLGPFTLVLRFSHHASEGNITTPILPSEEKDRDWVDVVDQVATAGSFSGWDTCGGAALEAQARLSDPSHDAYVAGSCLFLGPSRGL